MNMSIQKYTDYKPSGVQWLGDVPSHWEVIKIKSIAQIVNGSTPSSSNLHYWDGDIIWITPTDINNIPVIESSTRTITKKGLENCGASLIPKGSIILTTRAPIGKVTIAGKELCTNQGCKSLVLKQKISSQFIYYSLLISSDVLNSLGTGTTFMELSTKELKNLSIFLPPLEEQTAIAQYLDRKTAQIDTAIAQKQKMIELLKERRQILIHKAVTQGLDPSVKMKNSGVEWIGEVPEHWEVKKLKYLLKERVERSETGEEPLFMVSQVNGLVVRSEYHEKAEVAQSAVGNKKVYENDLVFNKLKAHLGVFFKSTIEFVGIVSPDYAVYYSKGEIKDLKYLELLFRSPEYITQFICKTTGIVEGLMRLYTSDLFSLEVPVPPIKEQGRILEYIEAANLKFATAIRLKEQEIEKLKEYKGSLINSVVTGKVRVA